MIVSINDALYRMHTMSVHHDDGFRNFKLISFESLADANIYFKPKKALKHKTKYLHKISKSLEFIDSHIDFMLFFPQL